MSVNKEYTNGEVTVVWKPQLCIHSENCVRGLPGVFNVNEKPWINMEGAPSDEIVAAVHKCPSGALTIKGETVEEVEATAVQVLVDGPIRVAGPCVITHSNGREELREKDVFLCRCGQSSNKPFCDGAHKKAGFVG